MAKNEEEIAPIRRVKRTPAPVEQEPVAGIGGDASNDSPFSEPVLETRRPTASALPPQTEGADDEAEPELLTRRSRAGETDSRLDIPDEYKRPGWDYEWKTSRINGADVDMSDTAQIYEGGWRPVLAASMPKLCSPGWTGKYISRLGQILYTRPMHLTDEARQEDYDFAERQKFERLKHASDIEMPKSSMRSMKPQIEIEGVVGTHKPGAKSANA